MQSRRLDENYAVKMQELFTVGIGADSLYTEDDVIAAARVFYRMAYQQRSS
ncbi:MAG: DUF1800 family protein [Bacteroidota bacterium]